MLISQITYIDKTTGTINGQSIMTISLKDTSESNGSIVSRVWAYGVISGPGTATISNSSDSDVCLIIDNILDIAVDITLTVTDSDGFICQTKIQIIKLGINVAFYGMNVDAFILPGRLVEFTPIDNVQAISGAPIFTIPAYSEYWFDKENDGIWDVQDSTGSIPTFNHIYGTSNYKAKIANLNASVYTEVGFNTITSGKELVVTSLNNCTQLSAYSETEDYLSRLLNRGNLDNSDMEYLEVTITTNCCRSEATICRIYPLYNISISQGTYTNTGINVAAIDWPLSCADNYRIFTVPITISGIDVSNIASIQYTNRGITGFTTVTGTLTVTVEVMMEGYGPGAICGAQVSQTNTIILTTTQGLVYTIIYTLSEDGGIVSMNLTIDSITTPTTDELNPCTLTITEEPSNTVLYLTPENIGLVDVFPDGIYQVTINDSGISNETVSGCTFVNCETYCLVIKALANECPTAISILYEALVYSVNCDNVSCQNLCDLYEMLRSLIDECDCTILSNSQPTISSNCGCNK
jgi:hypothetical protein